MEERKAIIRTHKNGRWAEVELLTGGRRTAIIKAKKVYVVPFNGYQKLYLHDEKRGAEFATLTVDDYADHREILL